MFTRLELICLQDNQKRYYPFKEPAASGASLEIDSTELLNRGQKITVDLANTEPLELVDFRVELSRALGRSSRMMVNGFQSWSRSEEMSSADRLPSLSIPSRPRLAPFGDCHFHRSSGRQGRFHSWTYTYFSFDGGDVLFLGSLDENPGYTLFEYDYNRDRLLIRRECKGAAAAGGYPLLRLYVGRGKLEEVMGEYFSELSLARRIPPRAVGWTSWYNYYTDISEEIVNKNLEALSDGNIPLDIFQIDDGWQSAVGDWLKCNEKFPAGMKAVAAAIQDRGYRPGLWLAPFVCSRESSIFQDNPQWLLRNSRNKPVKAGYNPRWKGWFYALDFYAPGFQNYLKRVFKTVQDDWGYSLLKLDFLYAAALLPRQGKSRGRVMSEVMEFIHNHTGESRVIGCGVPLGPSLGMVDYCRIGSDVAPSWESSLQALNFRERVSTANSLAGTIGRRHLDRRAFRNDPDVFILRDGSPGTNLNRLTKHQRYTLFFLNNLLGGLVSFSDDITGYTPQQLKMLRSSFPNLDTKVSRLENDNGFYRIKFMVNRRSYLALANLTGSTRSINLEEGPYFHPELFVLNTGAPVYLDPFETACFFRVEPREDKPYLLGAVGHIFPGVQVKSLLVRARSVTMELHEHASPESKILLGVPPGVINLPVNKVNFPIILKNKVHYVAVPYQWDHKTVVLER